jgi:hypothetical protein
VFNSVFEWVCLVFAGLFFGFESDFVVVVEVVGF